MKTHPLTTTLTHPTRRAPTASFRHVLLLAGLAAGLGLGSAHAADDAAPKAHSDGMAAAVSDTAITAKVKAKLMTRDNLDQSDINVTTTNGVVTLEGAVNNANAKSVAETTAKSVEGVKSVDNNLKTATANKASSTTQQAGDKTKRVMSDSWITTKVKSELLADSVSKGFDVTVKTIRGVVVLKGSLESQDAIKHVKQIAQGVEGVKSVDTSALTVAGR